MGLPVLLKEWEERQKSLSIGTSERYTGRQFLELIDIAEVLQRKEEERREAELEHVFVAGDLEKELIELGYRPDIVEKALTEFKERQVMPLSKPSELENAIEKYKEYGLVRSAEPFPFFGGGVIGGLTAGMVGGFAMGVHLWGWGYNPEAWPFSITVGPAIIGAVILGYPGYRLKEKSQARIEERVREAKSRLPSSREQIHPGRLVLLNSFGAYRVAYVKEIENGTICVIMHYREEQSNASLWITKQSKHDLNSIVCALEPQKYLPLTSSQLRDLPLKSILVCASETDFSYGFLGKKGEESIVLYSDFDCRNESGSYKYGSIDSQEAKIFLMSVKE